MVYSFCQLGIAFWKKKKLILSFHKLDKWIKEEDKKNMPPEDSLRGVGL